jgi:hypothetical protein
VEFVECSSVEKAISTREVWAGDVKYTTYPAPAEPAKNTLKKNFKWGETLPNLLGAFLSIQRDLVIAEKKWVAQIFLCSFKKINFKYIFTGIRLTFFVLSAENKEQLSQQQKRSTQK